MIFEALRALKCLSEQLVAALWKLEGATNPLERVLERARRAQERFRELGGRLRPPKQGGGTFQQNNKTATMGPGEREGGQTVVFQVLKPAKPAKLDSRGTTDLGFWDVFKISIL